LGEAEMRRLLLELFETELPPHDVHGRSTIVTLAVDCRPRRSKKDREFGRFVYRGIARYHAQKAWPQEVLDEFMRSNAMNHLWPYARNYVQISSAQLGLVPILLPPFRVSPRPPPIQEAP
jgi:hypothetical protein